MSLAAKYEKIVNAPVALLLPTQEDWSLIYTNACGKTADPYYAQGNGANLFSKTEFTFRLSCLPAPIWCACFRRLWEQYYGNGVAIPHLRGNKLAVTCFPEEVALVARMIRVVIKDTNKITIPLSQIRDEVAQANRRKKTALDAFNAKWRAVTVKSDGSARGMDREIENSYRLYQKEFVEMLASMARQELDAALLQLAADDRADAMARIQPEKSTNKKIKIEEKEERK